jgi:hypothetical protein
MVELQILEILAGGFSNCKLGGGQQRNAARIYQKHSQLHKAPFSVDRTGCHFCCIAKYQESFEPMVPSRTIAGQTSTLFPICFGCWGDCN